MSGNLKAVAELARVSPATASRVLSGSEYPVSEELRARVTEAAKTLDYVPNAQARALITGQGGSVGILVGEVGDPYFSAIIAGAHRAASERGALVTILATGRDTQRELTSFRLLQSHAVSAVVVAGSGIEESTYVEGLSARVQSFRSKGRVVLIGRHSLDAELGADQIQADNLEAGRLIGAHLRDLGHTRVGILSGLEAVTSTIDRIRGITDGLGAEPIIEYVDPTRDGGYIGARLLLERAPDVTAIVGTADQMAIGALSHCRDHGLAVPDRLSIVGCNDIWVSEDLTPRLTSVHLPLEEIGAAAVARALDPDDGPRAPLVFEPQLIVRDTTGPALSD